MTRIRSLSFAVALTMVFSGYAAAQSQSSGIEAVRQGMEYYKQYDFRNAAVRFKAVIADPLSFEYHGDAYFWMARTHTASENYDEAAKYLEHFIKTYPDNPYHPEARYEKGRLLYLQEEYEAAVIALNEFISAHPGSEYAANAFYWAGESLFALGELKTAQGMFTTVVTKYPTSFRAEAARYRMAVIELKYREDELLKLLKWSHEEYLNSLEGKRKLEETYAEVVASYQRRIAALNTPDSQDEIVRLTEEVRVLTAELETRETRTSPSGTMGELTENRLRALSAKEEALLLKEFYLDRLIREYEEKGK